MRGARPRDVALKDLNGTFPVIQRPTHELNCY
jgi:hypothetical protein